MENIYCFFVFRKIKLKFGVRGNFKFLTLNPNVNSKTQYEFEIFHYIMMFSPVLSHKLVTMATMNDESFSFQKLPYMIA